MRITVTAVPPSVTVRFKPCKTREECYSQEQKEHGINIRNRDSPDVKAAEGALKRSLVEWRVHGNLKVVAVEVGRLIQHRQHVRKHVLLVALSMRMLLSVTLRVLLALPLGPHRLCCSGRELSAGLGAVITVDVGSGIHLWVVCATGGGGSSTCGHLAKHAGGASSESSHGRKWWRHGFCCLRSDLLVIKLWSDSGSLPPSCWSCVEGAAGAGGRKRLWRSVLPRHLSQHLPRRVSRLCHLWSHTDRPVGLTGTRSREVVGGSIDLCGGSGGGGHGLGLIRPLEK